MALLDTMGLRRHPGTILPGPDGPYIASMPNLEPASLRSVPDNVYILAHAPASIGLEGFKVLTIFRDPRNVVLSYIAHRFRAGYVVGFAAALEDFWGHSFVETYRNYLGWRGRSVVIRYEDLPEHVIGDGSGIYRSHDLDWNTWTGKPSDWREIWDDTIESAWAAAGGNELLKEAGYG